METGTSRFSGRRTFVLIFIGAVLCLLVYLSPIFFIKAKKDPSAGRLHVGGTSVVFFMMDKWKTVYNDEKKIEVDYDSTGSTEGVKQMIDGAYAIGFTHAPVKKELRESAKGGEILHIPVVLCGVVPIYNLKALNDKPPLKFTADVLAKIFLGEITQWNDPALKKVNEGVALPDTKITVVYREDSSGTTRIFTEYLAGASPLWKEKVGPPKSTIDCKKFGQPMPRSNGVATLVPRLEGAIGYVDLLFAKANKIPYGAIENKDRTAFIHAEPENLTAAARGMIAHIPEDLTFNLTNRSGKDSYPISGGVWAVCYQKQPAAKSKMVADFLHWITHEGQEFTKKRTYASLPKELVARVDEKLKTIQAAP